MNLNRHIMKKTVISILLMISAATVYGQTAYDALTFSENNYEGTARTVAMGNAFTALGGDLGAVAINPAGSAVAGYSQFAITPALTFSTVNTQGVSPYADGDLPYFQKQMKSRMTRFSIPNLGLTLNWDTGRKRGLKSMTFGFILSKTASWDQDVFAAGDNSTTSFMGQMAAEATDLGYTGTELGAGNAFDRLPWKTVAGYQSGMISTFGGYDDQFVGASELIFSNPETGYDEIALGGTLSQSYGRNVTGGKFDYIFNIGANVSDFLYLGVNLGINSLEYSYSEYFKEAAIDPYDFEISFDDGSSVRFEQMRYNYGYSASGTGFFAKVGFILTPISGLRIGGAVQTPTVTAITERWDLSAQTLFSDSGYNGYSESPYGENKYNLRSPLRANVGAAYTFGRYGVISADYEMCNYGGMRFNGSSYDRDYFEEVNEDIRERFGTAHSFRAGIEIKPVSSFAVRAGYNISGSAEKIDSWGDSIRPTYVQNASLGLGYSSKGSFYGDLAVRRTFLSDEYFMPYADYIYDGDGHVSAPTPEIWIGQSLWKVLLTFGWRF
jgi:hypothetical protein